MCSDWWPRAAATPRSTPRDHGRAVEKHVSNIFAKINLPDLGSDNRRVLAVLTWLKAR